jgi:hypothetical protein
MILPAAGPYVLADRYAGFMHPLEAGLANGLTRIVSSAERGFARPESAGAWKRLVAFGSFVTTLVLTLGKLIAGMISGSVAQRFGPMEFLLQPVPVQTKDLARA